MCLDSDNASEKDPKLTEENAKERFLLNLAPTRSVIIKAVRVSRAPSSRRRSLAHTDGPSKRAVETVAIPRRSVKRVILCPLILDTP